MGASRGGWHHRWCGRPSVVDRCVLPPAVGTDGAAGMGPHRWDRDSRHAVAGSPTPQGDLAAIDFVHLADWPALLPAQTAASTSAVTPVDLARAARGELLVCAVPERVPRPRSVCGWLTRGRSADDSLQPGEPLCQHDRHQARKEEHADRGHGQQHACAVCHHHERE